MIYWFLFVALTCNALANIFIKLGAGQFSEGMKALFLRPWLFFSNVYFFGGVICFALALVFYAQVLSTMKLSVAYPIMTSLGFVIVIGFSVFVLREEIAWWQWLGIASILFGVILLSQGAQ